MHLALQNLFGWSVQITVLAGVAALASRLILVDSARVRYAWWRLLLLACLMLPILQPWHVATAGTSTTLDQAVMLRDLGHLRGGSSRGASALFQLWASLPPWRTLLVWGLATGAALRLLWLLVGLLVSATTTTSGCSASGELH